MTTSQPSPCSPPRRPFPEGARRRRAPRAILVDISAQAATIRARSPFTGDDRAARRQGAGARAYELSALGARRTAHHRGRPARAHRPFLYLERQPDPLGRRVPIVCPERGDVTAHHPVDHDLPRPDDLALGVTMGSSGITKYSGGVALPSSVSRRLEAAIHDVEVIARLTHEASSVNADTLKRLTAEAIRAIEDVNRRLAASSLTAEQQALVRGRLEDMLDYHERLLEACRRQGLSRIETALLPSPPRAGGPSTSSWTVSPSGAGTTSSTEKRGPASSATLSTACCCDPSGGRDRGQAQARSAFVSSRSRQSVAPVVRPSSDRPCPDQADAADQGRADRCRRPSAPAERIKAAAHPAEQQN